MPEDATETLGSILIVTESGHDLVNSDFERTVPLVRQSMEEPGFDFEGIEIMHLLAGECGRTGKR